MNVTLTNQQILEAFTALQQFNPKEVTLDTKRRLSRNLRKITSAVNGYEHDRTRLTLSHVVDKSRKAEPNQEIILTTAEQITYQPELADLLNKTQDVEIHTIELFDSRISDSKPADPHHAIDVSKVEIPPRFLAHLDEIVFVPCGQPSK